jgi:integrase-like protein
VYWSRPLTPTRNDTQRARAGSHILRHTSVRTWRCVAPARAIQELAGHSELEMTQRYMHLSPAALDAAIQLLDGRGHSGDRGSMVATRATKVGETRIAQLGQTRQIGGEAGIRTLDTGFGPYNGLANRRLQPLGHLTADAKCT